MFHRQKRRSASPRPVLTRYTPGAIPRVGPRCRHRLSASELTWHRTHPVHANERARHSPHHKGARDVPTQGRDLGPMRESKPCVHPQGQSTHPGREKTPPDRRHSHCQGRISRGITDASSVVAGLKSCNGAVPWADRLLGCRSSSRSGNRQTRTGLDLDLGSGTDRSSSSRARR